MDVPVQSVPPRPKPRVPRPTHPIPASSQAALPSQGPLQPRLRVLVEATQPFANNDNAGMLRWLLGGRVGGEDRVREVIVSQDRTRAIVEFVYPEVIQQLLSTSTDLLDPLSKQPLRLTQIDLTTLCLVVTGFPPFVDESALENHFQGEANDQQIHSVQMSADRESAMITFMCPTVAIELAGKETQLFGVNLHLELGCNSALACPSSTTVDSSVALCVQGLPEAMLNNPQMLPEALKWFIKQGTGFEAAGCSIVQGLAYLTFTDPSAVQAIVNNPPTKTFMSGSVLHMSATSQPPIPPQVSPTAPREAWGVPDTPTDGYLPGNAYPHSERPVTAPVRVSSRPPVPHRRRFTTDCPSPSNGGQHIPPRLNQPRQYQGDQYPHHQGQQQQQHHQQHFYNEPMHHSASFPDGVGTTTPTSYSQQLPYPPHGNPPYSGQPQGGQNTAITVQSGAPVQQGPQEVAHHPPAYPISMATAPAGLCRKVRVSDLPKEARNQTVLKYYFQSLAGPVASVELFKDSAVVTLENPTSMDRLLQLSRTTPLEGVVLALSALEPSDTVLVSGLNDTTPDVLVKFMLADYIKERDSVESVKRISPTHALVIFKSPDSVQKITSKPLIEVEGLQLSVKEHYPFMDTSELLNPSSTKPDDPLKPNDPPTLTLTHVVHTPQRDPLTKEQHFYLKNSLFEFNDTLESLRACADIEKVKKDYFVVISPLEGSGSIDEWKDNIAAALKEHFEELSIETINFPNKDAKSDIQDIFYDEVDSVLVVKRTPDSFTIAGSKEIITDICEKATKICLQYQVTVCTIELPRKRVKFLEKFYRHMFHKLVNKTSVHDIQFNSDNGLITVTANPDGHTEVEEVVQQNNIAEEKALKISQAAYKLLSSQRGAKKLNEIFGVSGPQIVYDIEQVQIPGDVQYYICFLSKDEEILKKVKKSVKLYVHEVAFSTSPAKIRVCSSKEWREFISTLSEEHFVSVTAQESSIVITGEQLACNGICEKVQRFLEKHTNIEERVTVSQSEWFVINGHFFNEVKGINDQAKKKQVKIEWPKPNLKVSSFAIVISGEPARVVDDIKVQVTMLLQKVCKKESRITGVPAVVHVLASMEDKLRLLDTDEKVRIEVTLENGDSNGSEAAAQVEGEFPRQVCTGTSPSGSRVSVYTGDFAQNAPVGFIVNFVTSDPNTQVGCFKHLLESGGAEAMEDFKQKVSQFMEIKPGMVFKTRHGQLKCSRLVHCVLPSWRSAETDANKEYFLDEALYEVMKDTAHSGSILITPLTSAPLHYPVNMFVRLVMDAVTKNDSDLQVSVYVEELQHANEFQGAFQTRNYLIHQKVPLGSPLLAAKKEKPAPLAASVKTISSNLGNFITIVNGDLLQQQADVFINSTNTNLNLKRGQLSQLLLNACGDELQKECSEYAPLKPGQVVVTGAKNLKCNQIFHIALPDYKTANSERVFRETVRQILRIAKNSSVSSIAIPSLGVANLGYPESVSAKILFQEVIAFHSQYPSSIQKFIFVIYEKNVFQAFSKEFAQQMSGGATAQAPPTASPPAAVAPPTGSTTLIIAQGNIAEESTDIIVNTTSEDMTLNKSAVSKAILEKAGVELQKTCKHYVENGMRLDHGQIVVTPAFGKLRCRKIIHAHVPHQGSIATSSTHHCQLIEKIVIDCLQKAEHEKMASISFPAFGLGGGGYSVEQVAEPMLKAFQKFGQTHPKSVKSIRVVIYDPDLYKQFNDFYYKFFGHSSSDPRPPPSLWNRLVGSSHKVKSESQELQAEGVASNKPPPIWALSRSIPNPIVVFTIFGASDAQCEKIATILKNLIKEKSTTKTITDVHIEQLIDDDLKEILQIGDKHGVHVKMVAKIKEIRISGETSKVLEAHGEIQKILSDIERSMIELRDFEWSSADDDRRFEAYPPEASMRLERAFNRGLKAIELTVDNVVVLIDIQNRIETDKTTGKRRDITRSKKSMGSVEFPLTWETPHMASGKRERMTRIEVDSGTPEYVEAVKEFEESLTKGGVKYSIEKVERIENMIEYAKHVALKDSIKVKHKKEPLVKRLFHGSKQESLEPIAVQGFNRNFAADANAAYYGRGVYFAVESSYSAHDKYAVPDSSGLQYMFVCTVIIGEYTKGNKDMRTAPPLTPGSNEVFDTLVENVKSPTIFVALTDAQAYPEYLITFKK